MTYIFNTESRVVKKTRTKNIIIKTKIPAPGTKKFINSITKNETRAMHGQLPIVWKKAKNYNVFDLKNNKFLDFTSTIFVSNIGHSNSKLIKNVKKSLNNSIINTYAYSNLSREKYLKALLKFAGKNFQKAFLLSAGTEATEAAFKLMRMYGKKIIKENWVLFV